MPTYDMRCDACGREHEVMAPIGGRRSSPCPACGETLTLLPSAPAWRGVGYGWTPRFSGRGRKDPNDTMEETESGQLRDKTGAGHDAPTGGRR